MSRRPPSERINELIRQGAMVIVSSPAEPFNKLDDATLASEYLQAMADDPVLIGAIRRSNRSIVLHWAAANISHPGEPVPTDLGAETLALARELMHRDVGESVAVDQYRINQTRALRIWTQIAMTLTSDVDELRELHAVGTHSITTFIDATIAGIHHQMRSERDQISHGKDAENRRLVALILDGTRAALPRIEAQLDYRLEQSHTAAVIWGDEANTRLSDLGRAAEALLRPGGRRRVLTILAGVTTLWVWLPGAGGPDLAAANAALRQLPGVRIALGPTAAGIEGFRTSHLDAITTQHTMVRLGSPRQIARFADIELVALLTADLGRADRFIAHTLGDFASADPELQHTVLTFVREQCNASKAATILFTHRNTLLRRISRANELLPKPLEDNSPHVAIALEALSWRGSRS